MVILYHIVYKKSNRYITQYGGAYIDSREVAEFIGKRHDNLLRDIIGYIKILTENSALKVEVCDFFAEARYSDIRGRDRLCYLITQKGCSLIANKLIGEKGVLFTAAYVTRFHELENIVRERELAKNKIPRLSDFNSAVRNILSGMSYASVTPNYVMNFLRGVYNPLGIEVLESDGESGYIRVTQIARTLGVYSDTGRPHGHAVAAIIEKLDVDTSHYVVVPYGLVGFSFRYDGDVLEAVKNWLEENNFPHEVPHLNFDYHIYYANQNRQGTLFDDFDYFDSYDDFDDDEIGINNIDYDYKREY